MTKLAKAFFVIVLLLGCRAVTASESVSERPDCRRGDGLPILGHAPTSVLLVPLLKGYPESNEHESWPKQPAAKIANFYRGRFQAKAEWLNGVRTWDGFFGEAERLRKGGASFDRIILIGHGGFDGPVLNDALVVQEFTRQGSEAKAIRTLEAQPGLADILAVTYDASRNPAFTAALNRRWDKLVWQEPDEVFRILRDLESRLEPPDPACVRYHCPATQLDSIRNKENRESKLRACEWVCRHPLFASRWAERVDADRFTRFADSLAALAKPGALILLGMCNPGTRVPAPADPWDTAGILARSGLAGGPHDTYAHLLAAATGRFVAGPVGQASARDIVERVQQFETGKPQRNLRVAAPPATCSSKISDATRPFYGR